MGRFDFTSPGAAAGDAITQLLLHSEQLKRQAMLDELNKRNVESEMADRETNRQIQLQNANSQELERQAHANERQATADKSVIGTLRPGQDVTGNDVAVQAAKRQGIGVTETGGATLPSQSTVGVLAPGAGSSSPTDLSPVVPTETKASPSQKDESVPKHQTYVGTATQLGLQQLAKEVEQAQGAGKPLDEGKVTERAMALGVPSSDVKTYVEEMFKRGHQAKLHIIDANGKIVNEVDIQGDHDLVHGLPKPNDDSGLPSGLTPGALDMVAMAYARGDRQTLRSMGWGKASKADKLMIINRAAQADPASGKFSDAIAPPNLARTGAETSAAGKALSMLTENQAAVESFAKTAKRNTDLFNRIKKDVPDWGSKFANAPVRAIADKLLGSTAMSEFQIVRQSLQTEYARLIAQPKLSGVLSDSARHEIEAGLSDNATIAQLEHALKTFATETENRRASFADQIAETKDLLGPQGGGSTTTPAKLSIEDLKKKHGISY